MLKEKFSEVDKRLNDIMNLPFIKPKPKKSKKSKIDSDFIVRKDKWSRRKGG